MRKKYFTPEAEIEKFTIKDVLTASDGGINQGGNEGGDMPDDDDDDGIHGMIEYEF